MEREGGRSGQQQWGKKGWMAEGEMEVKGDTKKGQWGGWLDMWGILNHRVKNIFVIQAQDHFVHSLYLLSATLSIVSFAL